jgi:hypothetical protein
MRAQSAPTRKKYLNAKNISALQIELGPLEKSKSLHWRMEKFFATHVNATLPKLQRRTR